MSVCLNSETSSARTGAFCAVPVVTGGPGHDPDPDHETVARVVLIGAVAAAAAGTEPVPGAGIRMVKKTGHRTEWTRGLESVC